MSPRLSQIRPEGEAGQYPKVNATADGWEYDTLTGYTDEQVRDVIGAALVAGTNVTITVNDAGDTITIAAASGYTDEQAVDAVAAALAAGAGISIAYNDAGNTITVSNTDGGGGGSSAAPYTRADPLQSILSANSSTTNKTATLAAAPTNGNILVLVAGMSANNAVTSVVQTGVTWAKVVGGGTNPSVEIWVGEVGAGAAADATVTWAGTAAFNAVWLGEYSGRTGTVDSSSAGAVTTSLQIATPTITPAAGTLVIAAGAKASGSPNFDAWKAVGLDMKNYAPLSTLGLVDSGTVGVAVFTTDGSAAVGALLGGASSSAHAFAIAAID